jgi:hypothetical protein
MDGRKNNRGTKGNNGGRTPKSAEIKLAEKMRNILDDETVIQNLANIVTNAEHKDHFKSIELWTGYLYGKPTQRIETKELEELPEIHFVRATKKKG